MDEETRKTLDIIRVNIFKDLSNLLNDIICEKDKKSINELNDEILDNVIQLWEKRHSDLVSSNITYFKCLIESCLKTDSKSELNELFLSINLFLNQEGIYPAISNDTNLRLIANYLLPHISKLGLRKEIGKSGIVFETIVNPDRKMEDDDIDIFLQFATLHCNYRYSHEELSRYIDKDKIVPFKVDHIKIITEKVYRQTRNRKVMDFIKDRSSEKKFSSGMYPLAGVCGI